MRHNQIKRLVLHEMRNIYFKKGLPYIDWMGYPITEDNRPSYHHIEKAENLKCKNESYEATIENGAYLGKRSHELLHQIELIDKDLYDSWNYIFSVINKMQTYPIDDVWNIIYNLKETSEKILYEENNNLIKK